MQTINEKKGYRFESGSFGKRWIRGNIMFSVGKYYTGHGPDSISCIVKTDLQTGWKCVASIDEHKKFLTPQSYNEFINNEFIMINKLKK